MRRPFQVNRLAAFWAVLTTFSLFVAPASSLGQWYCSDGDVCESCSFATPSAVCCDDTPADSHPCACPEDAPNRECRSCCRYFRADSAYTAQKSDQPDIFHSCLPSAAIDLHIGGRIAAPVAIPYPPPRATPVRPVNPRGPPPFA